METVKAIVGVLLLLAFLLLFIRYFIIKGKKRQEDEEDDTLFDCFVHLKGDNMKLKQELKTAHKHIKKANKVCNDLVLRNTEIATILRNDPTVSYTLKKRLEGLI